MDGPGEVVIETGAEPDAAVIWLHGLGADGHDFEPIVPHLGVEGVRFVFPHAPERPITVNQGFRMRAWFDIDSLDREMALDEEGLAESVDRVAALYREQVELGVAPERIVIAGFSQGGTVALLSGLTLDPAPAGILALSTFIPPRYREALAGRIRNTSLPVFMAHGSQDPVVLPDFGTAARSFLEEQGLEPEWHTYPMPHAVCPEEIAHIGEWLRRALA